MRRKIVWLVVSSLAVLALLVSCAPAAKETAPAPAVKEAAPVVKETAPVVKEAAPAVPEGMVRDSLGKLVEKPRYGGVLVTFRASDELYWQGTLNNWPMPPYESLMQWDWAKGPAGSSQWDGVYPEMVPLEQETGMLAESWEMPDANTMVFHIRKGVRWQNKAPAYGREMDAYDVEFTLRQVWTIPTVYANTLYPAKDHFPDGDVQKAIKATDKWTVVIKTLPGMLGSVYEMATTNFGKIAPPEQLKYDMKDWRNAGGTGAFIVTDVVVGSSMTYQRNPNYWQKDPLHPENQLPYLDGFKQLIIPDASTRLAAMRTGKLDMLGGTSVAAGALTWEDAAQLRKSTPELKSKGYEQAAPPGLFMRVDRPELPWYDLRVRRALNMAIDKQAIKDELYGGNAEIFSWPVLKSAKAHAALWIPLEEYPEVVRKLFEYHPEEAKKLLIAAGYPNGFKAEVITTAPNVDLLSVVAAYWKKNLNVELDIQVKEAAVYTSISNGYSYKQMIMGSLNTTTPKIINVRYSKSNYSIVTDPYPEEVLLKTLALYFDRPARNKLLREAFPYFWEQAWFIEFPNQYITGVWQPWVKNYYANNYTGYYIAEYAKYIWLDLDLKYQMTGKR